MLICRKDSVCHQLNYIRLKRLSTKNCLVQDGGFKPSNYFGGASINLVHMLRHEEHLDLGSSVPYLEMSCIVPCLDWH